MTISASNLNENQRLALDWTGDPMLVLAGPGSGKTAVLTLRIANLINNAPDERFRVLGLTFTVKAATEMQNRIRELVGEDSKRIQLRTFHSSCVDFLRQHGSHLGLRPDFQVITDEKDRLAVLSEVNASNKVEEDDLFGFLKKIDTMFAHGINPDALPKYFKEDREDQCVALQNIFGNYIDRLILENQLDFGSMLHLTCELLESKSRIAQQVHTVYKYVCIDEFQDTNLAQYKLLRLLCPDSSSNLFVVADDDQIIFQWNGASPKRLKDLKNDYAPQIVQLPENYRCPASVVKIANLLIANNPRRVSMKKDSVSRRSTEGAVRFKRFRSFEEEVDGLISEIQSISKNLRETCLVIARSNKLLAQAKEKMNAKCMKAVRVHYM